MKVEQKTLWQRTPLIVKEVAIMAVVACVLWCINYYMKG